MRKYIEVGIRQWGYTVKLDYAVVACMMYVEVGEKRRGKGGGMQPARRAQVSRVPPSAISLESYGAL